MQIVKLFDEKGKLFGLVNPIDLLVILLIVLVAGGVVYKTKFSVAGTAAKTVITTIRVPLVIPDIADKIKVGDKMVSGTSYTQVEVAEVKIIPAQLVVSKADGGRSLADDPWFKDLYVTVKGKTGIPDAEINLGGQEIRIGKDYYVKSFTYEFKGTIVDVKVE
ncbi:MAG: DUF4330 domain-containing protein [Carboxydocellales bacterium]|jgi:hypothetical protein